MKCQPTLVRGPFKDRWSFGTSALRKGERIRVDVGGGNLKFSSHFTRKSVSHAECID